jgi:hypothetical protein
VVTAFDAVQDDFRRIAIRYADEDTPASC